LRGAPNSRASIKRLLEMLFQEKGLMLSLGGSENSWMRYRPLSEKPPSMEEQPGPPCVGGGRGGGEG
jgi:hypothetical protein